jgi:hypothetical protein
MNLKLIILLVFTILSTVLYSQDTLSLEGVWLKENSTDKGIVFNTDSTFSSYGQVPFPVLVKYTVVKLDSVSYIEFSYIQNEKVLMTKQSKFKIENDKLYLPIDVTDGLTGEKRVEEYKDIYIRKR